MTSLNRLLARFLFAGAVAASADATAAVRDDASVFDGELDDESVERAIEVLAASADPVVAACELGAMLERMSPFDATRTAALAALSRSVTVRRALAEALISRFPVVGDDLVLDQLGRDPDPRVRAAARRAADVRRAG